MKYFFAFLFWPCLALAQLDFANLPYAASPAAVTTPAAPDGGSNLLWMTIETNGWVADVYVQGLTTNGTYTYGLGTSNSLTGSEALRITVTSPGYDDTGASNGLARTVVGTQRLRLPYNQQTLAYEVKDAGGVKLRIALSDYIHTNDTIQSIAVARGFYTNGSAWSAATNFTTCTNLSAVKAPRVIAAWSQPDYFLSGGSNYQVSLVAFQYSGQQKRPVRAVKFWSMDSAGNKSPTNIVLNPVIDITQTDAVPVIEFTNNVDCSTFVQGSVISNYAIVYPWWGPLLNLSDNVNPPGSADYCPSITLCDKSNVWAAAYATVDPVNGNDTTGTARTNKAAVLDSTNKAFLTIAQALNACAQTNNTFNRSNTLSNCAVYLTNSATGYDMFGGNIANYDAMPLSWTTVAARPDVNWSNVFITTAVNTQTGQRDLKMRAYHLVCKVTALANTFGQGYWAVMADNCIIQTNVSGGTASWTANNTNVWLKQSIWSGVRAFSNPSGNQANSWMKMRGNTFTSFDFANGDGRNCVINPVLAIGNAFLPNIGTEQYAMINDSPLTFDPFIWAYNKLMRVDGAAVPMSIGLNNKIYKGGAVVQNVVENTGSGGAFALDVMVSTVANEWCTNLLFINNTIVGVYHPPFNLNGITSVSADHYLDVNNIYAERKLACDVLDLNASATNRWAEVYGVGCFNIAATSIPNGANDNPAGGELGFDGPSAWYDSATNSVTFKFLSNKSACGGDTNGLGDYHLTAASPIVNSYMTGAVFLPYDIEGQPRAATNAPGAYAIVH